MGHRMSGKTLQKRQRPRQLEANDAELRDANQWMELAASVAELGMWKWDLVRDEIWITDKGRTLFGFDSSEELDLNRFRSGLHPDDREAVPNAVEHSLRTSAEYELEYRIVLPNGQIRWIAERGHVEVNGNGRAVRMRGASVDITKRRKTEEQLARYRDQMTHLSRVTTLVEVFGSIAHELNQPLSAILSNAQAAQRILANGADVTEMRDILNDIVSEDKRAGEVIHRLREWLKKGERQQRFLNINELVKNVLKLVGSYLIKQQVTATTEFARNLPAVRGDSVELQQLLVNLVVNACEAMTSCNPAERRLLIRTGMENGSNEVIVSVTDWGSGIPEESLEQIFEPFFTKKEEGIGLGLSVCRTIMAAHRGQLWATNNPDRGATFHFSLPVSTAGQSDTHK